MATETAADQATAATASAEATGSRSTPAQGTSPSSRSRRRRLIRVLLALSVPIVLGFAAWWGQERWQVAQAPARLTASGIVEADEILLSPEITGRLVALPFRAGDRVRAGDVVARLDESLVQMQIRQADPAERLQLEIQAAKHTLRSPIAGSVLRVPLKVGETVVPGQAVVVVTNPGQLEVNLYVRERDLSQVFLGQTVQITSDAFPDRSFDGKVTWISQRAEFTPRNVQTRQDRQNLVFAVEVRVPNPDDALRAGLPVDATFVPGGPAR